MKNTNGAQKVRWYQTNWGILLLIVLFFPVGLYLMWRKTNWDIRIKKGITGFIALIAVIQIISSGFSTPRYGDEIKRNTSLPKATSVPAATSKPAEKMNIQVTSQIVKKVDGKYRYFFDIRNKDTKSFEGSVSITLVTGEGKNLGGDTFNTNKPIESGLGSSQYLDIFTGPVSVHGVNGISKFKFTVKNQDKQIVNEGEGNLTDKLEDLDSF